MLLRMHVIVRRMLLGNMLTSSLMVNNQTNVSLLRSWEVRIHITRLWSSLHLSGHKNRRLHWNPFWTQESRKLMQCDLIDANLTSHEHFTKRLRYRGFIRSNVDPCLFHKKDLILILYACDYCIFGTSKEKINEFIESLKRAKDKKEKSGYLRKNSGFYFTVKKIIEKFLGVGVSQVDIMIILRKPNLIERTISTVLFQ